MKTKGKRRIERCNYGCPVEAALDVIGDKWKGIMLYHLLDGTKRFSELKRLMPGITQRVLTLQLRTMEEDLLLVRHIYNEIPPKVEYSLTPLGESLRDIIFALRDWGEQIMERYTDIASE